MSGAPRDPEQAEAVGAPAVAAIHSEAKPGPVHLTVADTVRSIAFYERAVGLVVRLEEAVGNRRTVTYDDGSRESVVDSQACKQGKGG